MLTFRRAFIEKMLIEEENLLQRIIYHYYHEYKRIKLVFVKHTSEWRNMTKIIH